MNRSNGSVRFLTLRVPDFPQGDLWGATTGSNPWAWYGQVDSVGLERQQTGMNGPDVVQQRVVLGISLCYGGDDTAQTLASVSGRLCHHGRTMPMRVL